MAVYLFEQFVGLNTLSEADLGEGPGGPGPPFFRPKPPSYLKVWIRHYIITQLSFPMNAKNGRGGGGRLQVSTFLYVCSFFSEVPGLLLCHK